MRTIGAYGGGEPEEIQRGRGDDDECVWESNLVHFNPQEIAGLQAVLLVIRAVTTYDEVARDALSEHPNWALLHDLRTRTPYSTRSATTTAEPRRSWAFCAAAMTSCSATSSVYLLPRKTVAR